MEHASARSQPWGEKIYAARTWINYRLEDLSGLHCMLVRYDRLDRTLLDRLGAQALFLSGSSAPPDRYLAEETASLYEVLAARDIPTFGFCGGMQAMAQSYGHELSPLADGVTESGYTDVSLTGDHPVLDGLGSTEIVRHAHALQVADVPAGFRVVGSTELTPNQMMVDDENKLVATQFHPEFFTDEHPAGKTMIENFMRWVL